MISNDIHTAQEYKYDIVEQYTNEFHGNTHNLFVPLHNTRRVLESEGAIACKKFLRASLPCSIFSMPPLELILKSLFCGVTRI